jgi:hypothetical protein
MTPPLVSYRAIVAQPRMPGIPEPLASILGLGAVGLRSPGRRPGVPFTLGTQDAAPLLVLGYWHPALDADAHPLARLGVTRKEPFQKGHEFSVSAST